MMREMLILTETRIWKLEERGAPLEESLAIDQTCANILELDILPREMSIGIEGGVSAVWGLPCTPPS